jgi:hypothetical protein
MSQNKTAREALIAEITRLEGMLSVRAAEEVPAEEAPKAKKSAEEVPAEEAPKAKKSSEDLVDEVALDTDMGEGAIEAAMREAGFGDMLPVEVESDDMMVDVMDDGFGTDMDEVMSAFTASETKPGIEDEITQDSLDEVAEEVGADDIATEDATIDVVSSSYVGRLTEASRRLDRVASYLEKTGQVKLAFRVDRLADALDSERSRLSK